MYVEINGEEFGASLPNPGKMQELLFPGTVMLLAPMDTDRVKYPFRVEGVVTDRGETIMLNTVKTNDCAAWLIENGKVPSLAGWNLVRREITVGDSRFDLLLEKDGYQLYCEVKSCTLFGGELCMFPDAVTERGKRHVQELGDLARSGIATAVLFLVHSPNVSGFCPDYHTDPEFSETLYENRHDLKIIPLAIGWDRSLSLTGEIRELPVRWDLLERHGRDDSGLYLFMVENESDQAISVGSLGEIQFEKGFYVYVGSAKKGLSKRLERHRRTRKSHHWHIDYLREKCSVTGVWPIRSKDVQECDLAGMIQNIADGEIHRLGSSDCDCRSHLFYFKTNPTRTRELQNVLTTVRMENV